MPCSGKSPWIKSDFCTLTFCVEPSHHVRTAEKESEDKHLLTSLGLEGVFHHSSDFGNLSMYVCSLLVLDWFSY